MPEAINPNTKLLLADDDEALCAQMRWALEEQYEIVMAHTPEQVLAQYARHRPDLVLLDLNYNQAATPENAGLALIEKILAQARPVKIIVVTGNQEREVARLALRAGAHDHLLKPINLDELRVLLQRASAVVQLEKESASAWEEAALVDAESLLLGRSPEMRSLVQTVKKVSRTEAAMLITGESGTGKELIARLVHQLSPRHAQPFVAINCGAIPENLLESELFGHEKGAFTGATALRKGKFEAGNHGTIFLDEIGELPLNLQVKLLRFLQNHTIERVGGSAPILLNVRMLAATNRDLEKEITAGRFRADLYYRLNVIHVHMPPLRARGEDLELLAQHFLKTFTAEYKKTLRGFSPQALKLMREYHWPGNVRELENKIRKAVILAQHQVLLPEDLELASRKRGNSLREALGELERELLLDALRRHAGVITNVAAELELNRVTLYDLLKKHNLDHLQFKAHSKGKHS
ncbi:MAG: sigma-54 dependent transcriptional regulator [candidate division KSB1 bacterium]